MNMRQTPLFPDPDIAKEKAPTTAPTVEQGQQGQEDDYQNPHEFSAPTEEPAQSRTQAASSHSRQRVLKLQSLRQKRALSALLTGPKTREQIDRIAGASNSPDVIGKMRRRFGLKLPCQRERIQDRDGHSVERGVYHLTDEDAATARCLLHTDEMV